jgi:hypothetical protein
VSHSLAEGLSRTIDPIFGNQTYNLMEAKGTERKLRAVIALLAQQLPQEMLQTAEFGPLLAEQSAAGSLILSLDYCAESREIGPCKLLDYSAAVSEVRWKVGTARMGASLKLAEDPSSDAGRPGLLAVHVAAPIDAGPPQ